jgi:hypothetical protein
MLAVAVARSVHCIIENPVGSMLFFSYLRPTLEGLMSKLRYSFADRCAYSQEPYGQRVKKPYKFLVTGDWLTLAKCRCPNGQHIRLMENDSHGHAAGSLIVRASDGI